MEVTTMLTLEQVKANCVNNLKKISSYKPYTRAFKEKNQITTYEGFGGYWINDNKALNDKVKELENNGQQVYAIIHNKSRDGDDMYSFLIGSTDEYNAENDVSDNLDGTFDVFAYVWVTNCEYMSEYGYIGVRPALGGLLRIY